MNTELAAPEGHAKVAVKVTDLGGGKWRYNYAVMNFDFSRAVTTGAEPNLKVVSNKGFDSFSVPVPPGATVLSAGANVGDTNPNMNWRSQVGNGHVKWSNDLSISGLASNAFAKPTSLPTLDWGVLYSFSFTTTTGPVNGSASLHVAQAGTPASYAVSTLVPGGNPPRASR
jgi:hypothetical protein